MAIFPIQKTPLIVAAPIVWFDASDTPIGSVASWTDKSGNGRNAVQAIGAFQPICTANLQAGKNGLVFTKSANKYLTSTFGITTTSSCTIFVVVKKNSLATAGSNDFLFDGIDATNRQSLLDNATTGKFSFGTNTSTGGATADTNIHIHSMQGGTTTGSYWIDGIAQFTNTNVGSLGVAGLTINSRYTIGNYSDSNFYEIIYYNTKLVDADRIKIQQYLSNKWGITIS